MSFGFRGLGCLGILRVWGLRGFLQISGYGSKILVGLLAFRVRFRFRVLPLSKDYWVTVEGYGVELR